MVITVILVASALLAWVAGHALRWRRIALGRQESEAALVKLFNETVESLGALLGNSDKEVADAFKRLSEVLDQVEPVMCRIELEQRLKNAR